MKLFLKDKLGLKKPIFPEYTLAERARWDPHFHASSLFADYFPEVRFLLPNFEEAYQYLTPRHRALQDRSLVIKRAIEERSFAEITEAGSSYDRWHFEHSGKKIIPILAHKRNAGAVCREDVKGYDMCGMEEEDHYQSQKTFFESVKDSKIVRVHMGETIIPAKGRSHVSLMLDEAEKYYKSNKPLRIGHGTHTSIEDMIRIAKKGYYIESCLSSNKRNGVIDKRSDYPLGIMLILGVKVVIGTDGGRLYSTTLPEEYAHAVKNLKKFNAKLKTCDQPIILPNGDPLYFKYISSLVPIEKKVALDPMKIVTYKELGTYLDEEILIRVNAETLIQNALELLEKCYPELAENHFEKYG